MSTQVTTTDGASFSGEEHALLAWLIYRRWGRDLEAAAWAWRRLFQNNCTNEQFAKLVRAHYRALGLRQEPPV